jgi:gluconolactonase
VVKYKIVTIIFSLFFSSNVTAQNSTMIELFKSSFFTPVNSFTAGAEGPAVDKAGVLYAVNFEREGTIGSVSPHGSSSIFVELPNGSVGNGIRFNNVGEMLIADYTNHNILKINMMSRNISVYAHEPMMSQPNDIAIDSKNRIYASDPDWKNNTGSIWRIDVNGKTTQLETGMGTTNGIEVSPDEKTLYVNETNQRKVWAYNLSSNGEVCSKRLLIEFLDFGLDGMRCDVNGNLYITRYGKGTIAVVSPAGKILNEIVLTGKNCSNVAFGGIDGKTVYVTIQDNGNIETFRIDTPGREWKMMQ